MSADLIQVVHHWSDEHGTCYGCGHPAAFAIKDPDEGIDDEDKRCAVCAANDAADGEMIYRLFQED
jgi:hypothetical protein